MGKLRQQERTEGGLFAGTSPELIERLKALKIGGRRIIDDTGHVIDAAFKAFDQENDESPAGARRCSPLFMPSDLDERVS